MKQILIEIQDGPVNPIDLGSGPVEIRKVYILGAPIIGKNGEAPVFDPLAATEARESTDTWNLFHGPEEALSHAALTLRRIAAWNGITDAETLRLHLLNPPRAYPID